jgi:hypothetical protein
VSRQLARRWTDTVDEDLELIAYSAPMAARGRAVRRPTARAADSPHDRHGVEAASTGCGRRHGALATRDVSASRVAVAVGDEQKAFDPFVGVEPARPEPIWTSHRQTSSGGASMVIAVVETGQSPMEFGSSSPGSVFLGS